MDVEAYRSAPVLRAVPIALPAYVDLSVDAPPPGDQGSQGSCVGWAVAYTLKSYHERIERGWPLTDNRHVMSPAYVYNQIKVPGGGAYYADAFRLLADQGVSSWAAMPYNWRDDRTQPSAAARAEAADYRIADWGTVLRNTHAVFVQEVKRHVAGGTPVLIAVPVHQDLEDLSPRNPVYDNDSGALRGYHAVVIVGYDDGRSAFRIVNSWGTRWGLGGYGWIDYEASERLIRSAYVTTDAGVQPEPEPEPENQAPQSVYDGRPDWWFRMAMVGDEQSGASTYFDAATWFVDPDGDPLTYELHADPPGIVELSFTDDIHEAYWRETGPFAVGVRMHMLATGVATVEVKATDPGGLSASTYIEVHSLAFGEPFPWETETAVPATASQMIDSKGA